MTKKKNSIRMTGALVIAVLILILDILFIGTPKKIFSENENRYLETFPEISAESLRSGEWMSDLNSWLCDHFPFRDRFMTIKTKLERLEGRKEINGILLAEDGYYIEPYKNPNNLNRDVMIWQSFEESLPETVDTKLMLVPTAVWTLQDKLPENASCRDQREDAQFLADMSEIPYVDCFDILREAESQGQLYYRTDHHWTTFGAYQGYVKYCEAAGLTPVPLSEWNAETVAEDFHGTVYSKLNDYSVPGDTIVSYSYPGDHLSVVYEDTGEVKDTMYNTEYLGQKDKYSYFLDNLHSLITITNENAETDRELTVIKDSYANSLIPFLSHHFRKIHVFDTRSYKFGPSEYILENPGITDVLILYNMNTLDTDLGIGGIF